MNFNFSKKPEYKLNASMIDEVIRLYGVLVKFVIVERIGKDDAVFGDFSHLKSDSKNIFDIYALPENSESYDIANYQFSEYGFTQYENTALFIAKSSFDKLGLAMKQLIGNLIVYPNNKVQEISDVDWMTPGVNNLFTFSDQKSVYKLNMVNYNFKLNSELDSKDLINDVRTEITQFEHDLDTEFSSELPDDFNVENHQTSDNYDKLDNYFEELIKLKDDQKEDAEIKEAVKPANNKENKPIQEREKTISVLDTSETNEWNDF